MNTNGPTDDVRGILVELSGLVSANDGSVGHRLTGTQDTNEEVFGGHPFRGKSECECYSSAPTSPERVAAWTAAP